jgi:Helix-turn-helix domain
VSDTIRRSGPRFSIVPEALTLDPEVTDRAFRVWCRLDRYAGGDGAAFPSVDTLAVDLACSPASIRRATKNLRDTGWLTRQQRWNGSNLYTLVTVRSDR